MIFNTLEPITFPTTMSVFFFMIALIVAANSGKLVPIATIVNPIIKCKEDYYYRNKLEFSFTENRWLTNQEINSNEKRIERRGIGFHISGMWDKVVDINKLK